MTTFPITLHGFRESRPGPRWRALFEATWPAYRTFYLSEGRTARPSVTDAGQALATHMPELLPTWAQLAEQTGFDDLAAAFLTGWDLPRFAPAACSQVALTSPGPALLRNYDYRPALFEQVTCTTDYRQQVIGTSDCLWGLLDGMNDSGLAISLAFGGDRSAGVGFAIPMVLRYLLETCATVAQAQQTLTRLPIAMVYNLTMIDTSGSALTAYVGPGRTPEFRQQPAATNHHWDTPLDPGHARQFGSVQRLDRVRRLAEATTPADQVAASMITAPMRVGDYSGGFGTLYTADYRLAERTLTYRWPGQSWTRTFDSPDDTVDVLLVDG